MVTGATAATVTLSDTTRGTQRQRSTGSTGSKHRHASQTRRPSSIMTFPRALLQVSNQTDSNQTDDDPSIWALETCCSGTQIAFICFFGGFLVLDLILWPFWVSKPTKMLAVFVHEMSHATATWMTCGKVTKLEVHTNEGGVCNYRGGWQPLIIPAGYLGGAFWGSACIVATSNTISCYVLTGVILAALLVALYYSGNWALRWMCLGFIGIILIFLLVNIFTVFKALKYVILYFGVYIAV
eukprot:gene22982-30170_t